MFLNALYIFALSLLRIVSANVEKTIFQGPETLSMQNDASLDNLYLIPLSPSHSTARTLLNASFPTSDQPRGTESWFLIDGLFPGARYEVRICWLATQPTSFWLYTHTITETFNSPGLITSLATYANARHGLLDESGIEQLLFRRAKPNGRDGIGHSSMLFLQIFAAADYFTMNKTLMDTVPPVLVDVILDPYMLNVFPESLIPTAGYIVVLAIGSWFLSTYIWKVLLYLATAGEPNLKDGTARPGNDKKSK